MAYIKPGFLTIATTILKLIQPERRIVCDNAPLVRKPDKTRQKEELKKKS